MDTLLQRAINRHGAKAVYAAACRRMEGDLTALEAVDIIAADLGDTWHVQTEAYKQMSAQDQASDYWEVQHDLAKL